MDASAAPLAEQGVGTGVGSIGSITHAMTAAPKGPRVLRVALVSGGKVIDERVIERADVTAGSSARATFFVDECDAHRLFERTRDGWFLHLADGMHARLSDGAAAREHRGPVRVPLTPSTRGSVRIGATTLLFQQVAAAPKRASVLEALTVPAPIVRIDWRFSLIAAFSFLAHFAFAGAMHGDFFDPTIDEDREAAQMIAEAKARPEVALEEKQPETGNKPSISSEPSKVASTKHGNGSNKPTTHGNSGTGVGHTTGKSLNALSGTLDALGLKALSSFDGSAPASTLVLAKGSTATTEQLDDLAKTKSGVDLGSNPLKTGSSDGGPLAPGKKPGLDLDPKDGSSVPPKAVDNSLKVPAPTTYDATPAPPQGNVPDDADLVVNRNRWRFKACYATAISKDPNAGGTVRVTVKVGEGGSVVSASGSSSDASSALTQCVASAFTTLRFAEPKGGTATFVVPVVLTSVKK